LQRQKIGVRLRRLVGADQAGELLAADDVRGLEQRELGRRQ